MRLNRTKNNTTTMKRIKIGGKERPVKFGLQQSIYYCELRNISITKMNEELRDMATANGDGSELRDFIYSALKDGARYAKEDFDASNLDVADWIEELDSTTITEFITLLADSMKGVRGKDISSEKK